MSVLYIIVERYIRLNSPNSVKYVTIILLCTEFDKATFYHKVGSGLVSAYTRTFLLLSLI